MIYSEVHVHYMTVDYIHRIVACSTVFNQNIRRAGKSTKSWKAGMSKGQFERSPAPVSIHALIVQNQSSFATIELLQGVPELPHGATEFVAVWIKQHARVLVAVESENLPSRDAALVADQILFNRHLLFNRDAHHGCEVLLKRAVQHEEGDCGPLSWQKFCDVHQLFLAVVPQFLRSGFALFQMCEVFFQLLALAVGAGVQDLQLELHDAKADTLEDVALHPWDRMLQELWSPAIFFQRSRLKRRNKWINKHVPQLHLCKCTWKRAVTRQSYNVIRAFWNGKIMFLHVFFTSTMWLVKIGQCTKTVPGYIVYKNLLYWHYDVGMFDSEHPIRSGKKNSGI